MAGSNDGPPTDGPMAPQAQRRRHQLSPEGRDRIIAANKRRAGRPGRKRSPEARANIAAANRRPEHRANISAALKGHAVGPDTRAKLSAALKGRPLSPEHRANISAGQTGRKHSPETRAKLSAAHTGRIIGPDTRAKLSAALKGGRFVPSDRVAEVEAILDRPRAGRPGRARTTKRAWPRVRLCPQGKPSFIDGKRVRALDDYEHRLIDVLLGGGPDDGLGFKEMCDRCGRGGWRKTLDKLLKDPDWGPLLRRAGTRGGRYRIMAVRDA